MMTSESDQMMTCLNFLNGSWIEETQISSLESVNEIGPCEDYMVGGCNFASWGDSSHIHHGYVDPVDKSLFHEAGNSMVYDNLYCDHENHDFGKLLGGSCPCCTQESKTLSVIENCASVCESVTETLNGT